MHRHFARSGSESGTLAKGACLFGTAYAPNRHRHQALTGRAFIGPSGVKSPVLFRPTSEQHKKGTREDGVLRRALPPPPKRGGFSHNMMIAKIKATFLCSVAAFALSGCFTLPPSPTSNLQPLPTTLAAARAAFPQEERLSYFYYNYADYGKETLHGCRLRSVGSHPFSSVVSVLTIDTEVPIFKANTLVAIAPFSMAKTVHVPNCVVSTQHSTHPSQENEIPMRHERASPLGVFKANRIP